MDFRFYHLEYNPFVTQSTDDLFWNAMYQRIWDQLLERIDKRQGIMGLLGEPGLGKTALLQAYRSAADPKYIHVIDGIDATQTPFELLASLTQACGLTPAANEPELLFRALYRHCHTAHASGRQMVWLIDDAHALSIKALENLHGLFERLHREDEPMLQLVLCGRPALQQRCQHPDLYRFEAALASALTLSPLSVEDRTAYIHHYFNAAGAQTTKIFSKGALSLIVEHTLGIPKIINITCTDVLIAGLMATEKPISTATVQTVLHDDTLRLSPMARWGIASAAGILLAAGIWGAWPESAPPMRSRPASTPVAQATANPSPTPAPAQMPLAQAAATTAQLMPTPQPVQATVPKSETAPAPQAATPLEAADTPETTPAPPVATPLEAQNKIRELRERQVMQTALANVAAIDRVQDSLNLAKLVETNREPDNIVPEPVKQTEPAEPAEQLKPQPVVAESTAPTLTPDPTARRAPVLPHPETPEVAARLSPEPRRQARPAVRPPKPAALVASASARLLCAMPRTGGQRGSDIVLLGHSRRPAHRLVEDGSQNMSPVLSPDGARLAYTSYRDGAPNIYLRDLNSGQETQLTTGSRLALPGTWSPNGRYLSLSQSVNDNNDIYIYDVAQKRLRRLTQHRAIDVSPSFAPDSQRLVFSSDRTGSPQLYITDINGLPPIRLTRSGSYNTSPSWSPQDDTIAFIGRGQKRALDLYLIKPDGSNQRRLTEGQRFHTPPAWLPDGRTLMGMSLRGAVWERHLMQLDPSETLPALPKLDSLCLAPQWVAYRVP